DFDVNYYVNIMIEQGRAVDDIIMQYVEIENSVDQTYRRAFNLPADPRVRLDSFHRARIAGLSQRLYDNWGFPPDGNGGSTARQAIQNQLGFSIDFVINREVEQLETVLVNGRQLQAALRDAGYDITDEQAYRMSDNSYNAGIRLPELLAWVRMARVIQSRSTERLRAIARERGETVPRPVIEAERTRREREIAALSAASILNPLLVPFVEVRQRELADFNRDPAAAIIQAERVRRERALAVAVASTVGNPAMAVMVDVRTRELNDFNRDPMAAMGWFEFPIDQALYLSDSWMRIGLAERPVIPIIRTPELSAFVTAQLARIDTSRLGNAGYWLNGRSLTDPAIVAALVSRIERGELQPNDIRMLIDDVIATHARLRQASADAQVDILNPNRYLNQATDTTTVPDGIPALTQVELLLLLDIRGDVRRRIGVLQVLREGVGDPTENPEMR
ncbi:MAG: hypothetical protein COW13_05580, partial [Candidatus Omnitrophica bacterium CG12_big_fil_rev_8_21_14_0_65_50_5]